MFCITADENANGVNGHEQPALPVQRIGMIQLSLKRASASRPSGEWSEDDVDVLENGGVVGCIFKANAAPVGASWTSRGSIAPRTAMPRATRPPDRLRQELAAAMTAAQGGCPNSERFLSQ